LRKTDAAPAGGGGNGDAAQTLLPLARTPPSPGAPTDMSAVVAPARPDKPPASTAPGTPGPVSIPGGAATASAAAGPPTQPPPLLPLQQYTAIFEDAIEQLGVLGDIALSAGITAAGIDATTARLNPSVGHKLTIRELKEFRFDSLASTVEEERRKQSTLQNTIDRENEASELLQELQRELNNERRLLEDEVADRNQVIQQLRDTIQEINGLTNSEQKYIKKETKAHESSVRQRCLAREAQLRSDQELVAKRLEQENAAHSVIVDFLSRQRAQLDAQIQDWMTKYEEDTEAKAAELEALKQRRTQDLDRFEELVAAYEALEKVVEEDRATKLRLAEERRVHMQRVRACARIQRWWRRVRQRMLETAAAAAQAKPAKKSAKKDGKKSAAGGKKKGK
ncbi:hypothetical protein HK405_012929, partial [Cladochytrium tenue]